METTKKDYHAMVTVYGWGKMMTQKRYAIANWLRKIATDLEQENPEKFTDGRFTARYMKKGKK